MSKETYLECMGCGAIYPPDYLTEEEDCPECGSGDLVAINYHRSFMVKIKEKE